jgi:hypothetical protein
MKFTAADNHRIFNIVQLQLQEKALLIQIHEMDMFTTLINDMLKAIC